MPAFEMAMTQGDERASEVDPIRFSSERQMMPMMKVPRM